MFFWWLSANDTTLPCSLKIFTTMYSDFHVTLKLLNVNDFFVSQCVVLSFTFTENLFICYSIPVYEVTGRHNIKSFVAAFDLNSNHASRGSPLVQSTQGRSHFLVFTPLIGKDGPSLSDLAKPSSKNKWI